MAKGQSFPTHQELTSRSTPRIPLRAKGQLLIFFFRVEIAFTVSFVYSAEIINIDLSSPQSVQRQPLNFFFFFIPLFSPTKQFVPLKGPVSLSCCQQRSLSFPVHLQVFVRFVFSLTIAQARAAEYLWLFIRWPWKKIKRDIPWRPLGLCCKVDPRDIRTGDALAKRSGSVSF